MNTAKQVNVMVGLLFVSLVGLTLYFIWDIDRAEQATIRQEQVNVERGAHLYSLNCRSCHGLKGQGVTERNGLPGAPLNLESNRAPELTGGALDAQIRRFHDTLVCGRVGTVMPPWSIEQGGALNFFQIEQLVLLITSQYSEEGWARALEEANHGDGHGANRGDSYSPAVHLTKALGIDETTLEMNDVTQVKEDDLIRIGAETLEDPYEVMKVTAVDAGASTIDVERGTDVAGSKPIEHLLDAEVYHGPLAPGNTLTGDPEALGAPPCGQRAAAPATDGGGGGDAVALVNGGAIAMGDNFFDVDGQKNPPFSLAAGASAAMTISNSGSNPHNMRTTGADGEFDTDDDQVSDPDLVTGGDEGQIGVSFATAGTYKYRCDFHPVEMAGDITVQ